MITKEALDAARARGAQKVLARYGLDKLSGVLSTLGGAATRALGAGTKAYQHGGGSMMQNLGKGLAAGAKGFQRAGGVPAAGKALGAAAAGGAAAYGAGRMFGAGQQAAQKQANSDETDRAQLSLADDLQGILNTPALGLVPIGNTLQAAYRGGLHGHNQALSARGRMWLGNMLSWKCPWWHSSEVDARGQGAGQWHWGPLRNA